MLETENIIWLENWFFDVFKLTSFNEGRLTIHTIDNPGWRISINLKGTFLESKIIEHQSREVNNSDWVHFWTKDGIFQAAGGFKNLNQMLGIFRQWVEAGVY